MVAGYYLLAVLAAFGTLSAAWALFGWLLPVCREGWLLYPGRPGGLTFVYLYLWLRGMGFIRCPLILADLGLSETERTWLAEKESKYAAFRNCRKGLELERNRLDGRIGNHPGRHQRRGISKL